LIQLIIPYHQARLPGGPVYSAGWRHVPT
jgi:hypothetical protein